MNFFEQELRRLFEKDNCFEYVKFIGKSCYGTLGEKTRMKLEFVTLGTYQKYEGIRATVLDKTCGEIDTITLKFSDIWGKKKLSNPNFRDGIEPYIWIYNDKSQWYAYQPTQEDYKKMAETIRDYAGLFKGQKQETNNDFSIVQHM